MIHAPEPAEVFRIETLAEHGLAIAMADVHIPVAAAARRLGLAIAGDLTRRGAA